MAKQKQSESEYEEETVTTEDVADVDLGSGAVQFGGDGGDPEDPDDVVVDLGEVDDRITTVPPGVYNCVVSDVQYSRSQRSDNPMWTIIFEISDGDYAGRRLYYHNVFSEGGMPRVKRTLKVLDKELAQQRFSAKQVAESGVLLGKECRIKTRRRVYEGQPRAEVQQVLEPNTQAFVG